MTKKQMLKECEKAHKSWIKEMAFEQKQAEVAYANVIKFIERGEWAEAYDAMSYTDHLGLEYSFSQAFIDDLYDKANQDEN